jgi:hypothetical protein
MSQLPEPNLTEARKAGALRFEDYAALVSKGGASEEEVASACGFEKGPDRLGDERVFASLTTRWGEVVEIVEDGGEILAYCGERHVGTVRAEGGQVLLAVDGPYTGEGVGTELAYQFRVRFPFQKSGGLSEGGRATLRRVHARLAAL